MVGPWKRAGGLVPGKAMGAAHGFGRDCAPTTGARSGFQLRQLERFAPAVLLVAEGLHVMSEGVGQRHEEAVVGLTAIVVGKPHQIGRASCRERV